MLRVSAVFQHFVSMCVYHMETTKLT